MQRIKRLLPPKKVTRIGFWAGIIWGSIFLALHYLSLSHFGPGFFLRTFFENGWTERLSGHAVAIGILTLFSIIVAYVYYWFFRNLEGVYPGIILGIIFCVLFSLFSFPRIAETNDIVQEFGLEGIMCFVAVSIFWGVFIAYSISFESNNETLPDSIYTK